jgi:transglutaminase-like putative cysteine protease
MFAINALVCCKSTKQSRGQRRGVVKAGLSLAALLLAASGAFGQGTVPQQVDDALAKGQFSAASQLIRKSLTAANTNSADYKQLLFELDRLERIKKDFRLTESALFAQLQKRMKGITWQEFQLWIQEKRFDSREIDGERRYMATSVSNLFCRHPELEARRLPPERTEAHERKVLETVRTIRASARVEQKPYVLPKTFRVTMTVKADAGAVPVGEPVRAWLPIPRKYPFQDEFTLRSTSSPVVDVAPEDSRIRSVLLEAPAGKKGTEFTIHYDYTMRGIYFDVDPAKVRPGVSDPAVREFTNQVVHISFSPQMRALSDRLVAGETNPWVKARRFYEWIGQNIQYSYAIEYSTIRNIADYCLEHRYGDCGQEALLFMSLCRLNGIPARWQSGWNTFPDSKNIHDWTEIYIEPYGWMPVDPYMSIFATQYTPNLSEAERREIRDFYFGGLDQYRLIANCDHSKELAPAKRALRSDTVDFQRGELESGEHNIYFDQFDYDLVAKEIKPQTTLP